ncbi:MAG TPA: PqqD family protein [Anaerolineae bacterium]|nr:PqqD family protein [Anaerolineae bacterium]
MISLDSYPLPNPAVVGRIVEGEAVLVLPEQGQVKVLNEVGARIWALADGTRTLRRIAATLCHEYEVDLAQAEADTCAFAADLEAKGIISLSPLPLPS